MTLALTSISSLRDTVRQWRAVGESVALVPTMGALHAGHMALIAAAKAQARRVVVSIFVNPAQFGPNEDFDRYPRPLANDMALLREASVDVAWLPGVEEMYPRGFNTKVQVGSLGEGLEGVIRPGHFDGVATVVSKLLLQVGPDAAVFGEKDYQQLCVIRRMVADLNIPVHIIGMPTVREVDGLALSSRNQYLSAEERKIAPRLYTELQSLAQTIVMPAQAGIQPLIEAAKAKMIAMGFVSVDYLELCDALTLQPLTHYTSPARLLVAARLGGTRLIDNMSVE